MITNSQLTRCLQPSVRNGVPLKYKLQQVNAVATHVAGTNLVGSVELEEPSMSMVSLQYAANPSLVKLLVGSLTVSI